jgi:hypothetical protein
MITFKTLLETVYEPKSGDEKNFKDKHIVAKYKTPYDTESQFTSTSTKAKRKADYDSKEDEQVYEAAVLHTKRADKAAVIVRAVDPNTGQSKTRVVNRGKGEIKIGEAMDPVGKHDADIDNDGDTDKSDKYLIARRKAISKAIRKEEVEQIDEISVKKLDKYRAANEKDREDLSMNKIGWIKGSPTADQQKNIDKLNKRVKGDQLAGTKKYPTVYKNTPYAAKVPATEEVEQIDELSPNTLHSYIKKSAGDAVKRAYRAGDVKDKSSMDNHLKALKRQMGIASASGRLADKANSVSENLDEAFKIGAMRLKDGSTVTLNRESVDMLNKLFTQLNSANKAKMEERMMSGKSGFQEILSFAENI